MPQQSITIGSPDSGTGDPLRTAFTKIESNFNELYGFALFGGNISASGNSIVSNDTNGNIILDPNGTGAVIIDNFSISDNTISSTDSNGDIILDPNGTGKVGINTSTPAALLHIDVTSSDPKLFLSTGNPSVLPTVNAGLNDIVIDNLLVPTRSAGITLVSGPNTDGGIAFDDGTLDGFAGGILYNHPTDSLQFYTGPDATANLIFTASKEKFSVNRDRINVTGTYTPATSQGAAGDTAGDVAFDSSFVYYCTADYDGSTAIWVRATLNSF